MSHESAAVSGEATCPSRWLLPLASLALLLTAIIVEAQQSPQQLVQTTIEEAFAILRDPGLRSDPKLRLQKLRQVVDRAFDWEAMARSSLGAPWRELNDPQRADFVSVFKELLAQRYMDDIDRFQGSEELKVTGSDAAGELTVVKTVLITASREQVPIDYTLHKAGASWRVEDVSIEGISLVNHYRKTFTQYLSNKSFEALLAQLKQRLGKRTSPAP